MNDPNSRRTPEWIWNWMIDTKGGNFNVVADMCADKTNFLTTPYVDKEKNAMKLNWIDWLRSEGMGHNCCWWRTELGEEPDYVFLNPPYLASSDSPYDLTDWVAKAHNECKKNGIGVIMLIPAPNGELGRWSRHVFGYARHIYFIEGRVAFPPADPNMRLKKPKKAPFGSVLIVFDPRYMCENGCRTIAQLEEKFDTTVSILYQGRL